MKNIITEYNTFVLLKKDYYIIEYDKESKCIIQRWYGFLRSSQFRKSYLRMLKFLKKYEVRKVIYDTKYLLVIGEKDINWVVKNVNPVLIANNVKHLLFTEPESLFTKWSIDNLVEKSNENFIIKSFSNYERALKGARQIISEVEII